MFVWQSSLLGFYEPTPDLEFRDAERTWLDDESFVDVVPNWLSGSDELLARLLQVVPLNQREVVMYHRRLPEPRLTSWWSAGSGKPVADPVLEVIDESLGHRYAVKFDSIGFNLYRTGEDSVAWHRDREFKACPDPVIAIVSLGEPRPFKIRPLGGGHARSFDAGDGMLLVMGGQSQHRWEHAVPKVHRAGPRMSVTFRHSQPGSSVETGSRRARLGGLGLGGEEPGNR